MKNFPTYRQPDAKDCGPTCIKIIAKFYKKVIPLEVIRDFSETQRNGTNLLFLGNAAEKLGFRSLGAKLSLDKINKAPLPCVILWNNNHFVVLYKIIKNNYYLSDPMLGLVSYSKIEFVKGWIIQGSNDNNQAGITMLLETTPSFYQQSFSKNDKNLGFKFLLSYVVKYKALIIQLVVGLFIGSLLQLIFPFLIQSIVDVGIKNQDLHFIYLILIAQIFLFIGKIGVEVLRSWILLHLSNRINISLISDFLIKLMKLPMAFFDTKSTGDIIQRIQDHKRIERLLTTSSLNVLFSAFNLIIFGLVLYYYNLSIFGLYVVGTFLYIIWISLFLKKRGILDRKKFILESQEYSKVIELINGMQEIKLNNAEKKKRWGWEYLQARLHKISTKSLTLEQYQSVGSSFINEVKNILITFLSAKLVIDGDITLGVMLAISYMVGLLNSPISQLINFIKEYQDAKISLERLSEIHLKKDENQNIDQEISEIPNSSKFKLKNISFRYLGTQKNVLRNLSLVIPANKITAIVGVSGSGKTTLMKLMLKFYKPSKGKINIGNLNLSTISQEAWRNRCGVVIQEGFLFNDTIANNIAVGVKEINKERLAYAIDVASAKKFIEELPLSYNTQIGAEGLGLSTGQKQRILIARAVYKNPDYLFFDEATSALDSNNEKNIMKKLSKFFKNKTVVIIAHRLSTVKKADQIVVLDKGKIVEKGNHENLVNLKGMYFKLIQNQLELSL